MGGGAGDCFGVAGEVFEPVFEVGGVVVSGFGGDVEAGAEHGGSEFGDEFFSCVLRGVLGVAEVSVESVFGSGPVGELVEPYGVVGFG